MARTAIDQASEYPIATGRSPDRLRRLTTAELTGADTAAGPMEEADLDSDAGAAAELLDSDSLEPEDKGDDSRPLKPWDPALIRVEPKSFSLRNILDMIDEGELELEPDFQRRRVWKPEQKSLLIESILLRIPLPAFYFAADDSGKLQVVDGLQRLSTIHDFVRGGKDRKRFFRLSKLEYLSDYVAGKTFEEIKDSVWGRRISSTQISANIVDPQTPPPVKLNIFGRINRQGTPLSQQELRHAMSQKRSRDFLSRLVGSVAFQEATDYALLDHPRMADREVALRFCGFDMLDSIRQYDEFGSLTDLLGWATERLDTKECISNAEVDLIESRFNRAMKNSLIIFGNAGFRKPSTEKGRKPLSRPLFDAWSFYLGRMSPAEATAASGPITNNYAELFRDEVFMQSITFGTGDPSRVLYRFQRVEAFLASLEIPLVDDIE